MTDTPVGGTSTPLSTFYVTFGMMYRHERHPYWECAHPDGWLTVMAPDEEAARWLIRECVGNRYAFIYPEDRFNKNGFTLGEIAMISTDGSSHVSRRIDNGNGYAPARQFGPANCQFYGVATNEVVGARIEGILSEGSDADCIEQLGYEAELVHKRCLTEGLGLFESVYEVDSRVMAGELDYNDPHNCPICDTSIT